jgi:hypothetical protein
MTLADMSNIAQIVGAAALVVSALLLLHELRESNRLTRAGNTQALVGLSSPYHMGLIQDRKVAEFYVHGARDVGKMDEVDRYRYQTLLVWWLVFHENAYYQWRRGWLDNRSYKPWSNELKQFIQHHNLGLHWDRMRQGFQDDFARYVDRLIREGDEPTAEASCPPSAPPSLAGRGPP